MTVARRVNARVLDDYDEIVTAMREAGHHVGVTRQAVLRAVLATSGAFTADDLAHQLDGVHVSTVYRSLSLLEEIGVVDHVHLAHGPALYERAAQAGASQHLVCDECGRHQSVPSELFDEARRRLDDDYGFTLGGGHFAISGRCADCRTPDAG
jgi:Fur family transcriptional regulator, ferric uptake regulator